LTHELFVYFIIFLFLSSHTNKFKRKNKFAFHQRFNLIIISEA